MVIENLFKTKWNGIGKQCVCIAYFAIYCVCVCVCVSECAKLWRSISHIILLAFKMTTEFVICVQNEMKKIVNRRTVQNGINISFYLNWIPERQEPNSFSACSIIIIDNVVSKLSTKKKPIHNKWFKYNVSVRKRSSKCFSSFQI